jgi:hypothetical protein
VNWDGYMKYFKPRQGACACSLCVWPRAADAPARSVRTVQRRQQMFADSLLRRFKHVLSKKGEAASVAVSPAARTTATPTSLSGSSSTPALET